MHRRDVLRLARQTLIAAALPACPSWPGPRPTAAQAEGRRLFFDPEDLPRIRANARTGLLRDTFEAWRSVGVAAGKATVDRVVETGNLLQDQRAALETITRESLVYLVTEEAARADLVVYGIRALITLPKWDYLLEGGREVVGLQRASLATARLLFAAEALGDRLDPALREAMLDALAEKGCLPCYRALWGMRYKDQVKGWSFDQQHDTRYKIRMDRWPWILDRTNLKAIPVMGLGLGALALEGRDERAGEWLEMAVSSAQEYLALYDADGSYFEGLSYVDYAFRSMLLFLEAHYRTHGTIDWIDEANFHGVSEYLVCMQAGRTPDGAAPDIVNFSDARYSFRPMVASWIGRRGGDALARYAARHFSLPGYFADFLWYDPDRPVRPPPEALKNKRFDLDWIVCRTGWADDDAVVAFRSGLPANHEHADRNSFFFKAYSERLLTDPFGAAYDWRQPGWVLRLTGAHNAVLLDGRGHQYHDGSEGTNSGKAEARVVRYVDRGDVVWWCSDATHSYWLVDEDVEEVLRSLLFVKPDLLVVFDQVKKRRRPSTMAVRFHPDNRDAQASLTLEGADRFQIRRPKARLHGWVRANVPLELRTNNLAAPDALGRFPYLEALTPAGQQLEILSVLVARPEAAGAEIPKVSVNPVEAGWDVDIDGGKALVHTAGRFPELTWS